MSALTQPFPTSALPTAVQTTTKNFQETARKPPAVNLSQCALMEMVQYSCNPPEKGPPQGAAGSVIECESVRVGLRLRLRRGRG
ncbi:conserved hypothetical protein [Histoplasma capsulatum var. duboisii H88]|uniref:Uncharacterized protein n=2 Tax=Ajellomyces capsulatus TaxID=5037 RepID=F0UGV9_AJEC8|nr:conserved hypothetical protein [Histoplasma capsulatum H143]EGC45198.1 conserved hypothetical protein [Histoplasma capsulatum var. duboisii H88]